MEEIEQLIHFAEANSTPSIPDHHQQKSEGSLDEEREMVWHNTTTYHNEVTDLR